MNLKKNKTKIIAGVVLLLVLISSTLSFVGCVRSEPQVEKGQYYYETHTDRKMCFKIVSDKCTFCNNVEFYSHRYSGENRGTMLSLISL